MFLRERESVCVYVPMRERVRVREIASVYVREREREGRVRECVPFELRKSKFHFKE